MANLFDKNPNYNPNDSNSNRYLQLGESKTPQYSAGALSLLNLSKPLFNTPFVSSADPLAVAKSNPTPTINFNVPQGTKPLAGGSTLLAPATKALNNGGSIPGIIPAPAPTPAPTTTPTAPIAPAPITPSPAPVAAPTGKTFYREGASLFDSTTGAKILNPADLKAGGYTGEVNKPSTILPGATGSPTDTNPPASDLEIQNILKLAGEAGIDATTAMTMVDNYNALTKEERQKIQDGLGISDVVAGAYNQPTQTTMDYFNKGYAASDLPTIKNSIAKLDETINQRNADLAKEIENLQNNPWLSQASRTGRLGILNTKATNDITNLTNQRQQLLNQYDKGVTALESDVTRYKNQLESDRTINANKLNYLLNEAEKQYTTASAAKKTDTLKYLPDYLKTAADNNNTKTAYELEKARLENIKLAQDAGATGESNNADNSYTNLSQGIVGGYDISSYATDPNHEKAVQGILTGIGKFNSISDIDAYIKNNSPQSPITGQMIANAAGKYGVSWEMMAAIMKQDSNFADPRINDQGKISAVGARQRAYRTMNPGNVGNNDSGANVNQGSWQGGVDAVASWLSNHKSTVGVNNIANDGTDPYSDFKSELTSNGLAQFNALDDISKSNTAQLINGDVLLSDLMTSRGVSGSEAKQKLLSQAISVDPTFSENTNKLRYDYKKQFNNPNGKEQLQINSINTALGHLAEFNADAQALGNTIALPYNKLVNYLKTNTGNPDVAKLNTVITALSGELAGVYKGGTAPTDQETEQWRNTILASYASQQSSGVAGTAANLISSKLKALNNSYMNVMGAYPDNSMIDSNALQQLKASGVDTSKIEETLALQTNYVKGRAYTFGDGSQHTYLGNNQFSD